MTVGDIALRPPLTRDEASTLLDKTMGLVAATLGAFALGAYLGRDLGNASLRHAGRPGGLVDNRSQGVQLGTTQALARYWAIDYNWRACEARLNVLPQFTTQIDGVEIHFVHVRSLHPDALPLVMTHAWPGSVIELLDVAGPLTDPTAHGGLAEEAFDLMLPSLPGYGSSGEPTDAGWNPGRGGRGLGRADESPRLHPPRRPGWRRGGPWSPT